MMIEIEQAAQLMANRFWNDPGTQVQLRNVSHARQLFEYQCLGQLRAYRELGLLSLLEGGPSFSVSYRSDELDVCELARLAQEDSGDRLAEREIAGEGIRLRGQAVLLRPSS